MARPWSFDRAVLVIFFLVVLALALLLAFLVLPRLSEYPALYRLTEHITITLSAASLLGLAFELLLYEYRKRSLTEDLTEFREQALITLKAMGTLAPREVLDLVKDIASSPEFTPTLYDPPRTTAEYNFIEDASYFDGLVGVARGQVVEVLRTWLHPDSHTNVRFLGSDFVGKYRLQELAHELKDRAERKLRNWDALAPRERDCTLNFLWAASRCEKRPYTSLGKLLQTTSREDIQEWILFVPQQMPDKELIGVIDYYLQRNKRISSRGLIAAASALAAVELAGHPATPVVIKHTGLFNSPEVRQAIQAAWESRNLGEPPLGPAR